MLDDDRTTLIAKVVYMREFDMPNRQQNDVAKIKIFVFFGMPNVVTWQDSCSDWLKFELKNEVLKRFIQVKLELK